MKKPYTKVGAVIFGIAALIHLLRLILHFSLVVGGFLVPIWFNAIGLLMAGLLAVMLWRESDQ